MTVFLKNNRDESISGDYTFTGNLVCSSTNKLVMTTGAANLATTGVVATVAAYIENGTGVPTFKGYFKLYGAA